MATRSVRMERLHLHYHPEWARIRTFSRGMTRTDDDGSRRCAETQQR
jgi:hypothetical protein